MEDIKERKKGRKTKGKREKRDGDPVMLKGASKE